MDNPERDRKLMEDAKKVLNVNGLTSRESAVLRYSLLSGSKALNNVEIAEKLDISAERVEEIRLKALRKLRHPSRAEGAQQFLDLAKTTSPRTEIIIPKAIAEIEELSPELLDRLRSRSDNLEKLKPDVFEHLVGELLASRGFKNVSLVGRSQNTSADLIAAKYIDDIGEHKYFVEVKRWKDKVGVEVIDRVHGAVIGEKHRFGWTAAMIVSIVGFKRFRKYTRQDVANLGIYLKDKDDLLAWLNEYEESPNGLWLPSKEI
ncbi:restriction endonuclease [Marinomonas sp. PE14-40]|uniref:restriction endonuclease n=1 Tax=Marinomonas sp. PE14-40 TaxID=3060621 RepID=UPI003F67D9C5